MAGRGQDLEDGGTYLLAYRSWDTNPWFFSGVQYVVGPFYDLFDESIPALRLFRVVVSLLVHLAFGLAFTRWWAAERGVVLTRLQRTAVVALLVASAGMTYLWSPLNPGYYWLSGVLTVALVAVLLATLRVVRTGISGVTGWALLSGALSLALVVTRTPSALAVLLVQAVALASLWADRADGPRRLPAYLAGLVGGAIGLGLAWTAAGLDVVRAAEGLLEATRIFGAEDRGLSTLLGGYARTTLPLAAGMLALGALPLLALVVTRRAEVRGASMVVLGTLVATATVFPLLGWGGGRHGGLGMVSLVLACGLLALAACFVGTRPQALPTGVLVVLAVAPVAQALGTNVPIAWPTLECLTLWVSAVLVLSPLPRLDALSGRTVLAALSVMVVVVALLASTTTLMTPFKTSSWSDSTTLVPELGVRVTADTAAEYAALTAALEPHVVPGRTPVVNLDRQPTLVVVVGGVHLGSPWTDAGSQDATAALVRRDCETRPLDPDLPPVLIVDREVPDVVTDALADCGVDFPAGYRRLDVPGGPEGVRAWVPADRRPSATR